MKRLVPLILLLALAGSSAAQEPAASPLPTLRVDGNRFVDEDGEAVLLRGVSFSDPDRLEKLGHWNREYFAVARDWGANVVRFPVHPSAWRERGEDEYLRLLDRGLAWAGELGMYVIIDWHSIGNLRTELFQDPMYNTSKTETFRFWKAVSERFEGNPVAAFYEVFNEPTAYHGTLGKLTWLQHKRLMEDIIYMIYAIDDAVIPLVGGLDWAYDLSYVREHPVEMPGIGYVTHPYPQKREQPWAPKWQEEWGFVADTYPLFATELGFMSADGPGAHNPVVGDETYGEAVIDFFEERGISWTAWVFDPVWSPQLFEDWETFAPTMQGRFFQQKMRALNAAE